MKNQDYTAVITVNKSLTDAMKSISNVSNWWTENLEGSSKNRGDVFTVRFGETFSTMEITEVEQDKKIVWHVTECYLQWLKDKREWKGTEMVFELSSQNNSTQITFTHVGLAPAVECYNDCVKGWDQYIKGSLFKLITEGKGQPDKKVKEQAVS
jgi:Activator of Hsp90 ATPase homolog 1-like protein